MLRDSAMIASNNPLNIILRENSSYSEMFWKLPRILAQSSLQLVCDNAWQRFGHWSNLLL